MDVRMPVLDGLEATRRLPGVRVTPRECSSSPPSTWTSTCTTRCAPVRAAFCSRTRRGSSWSPAVRVVAGGESLLAPAITRRLIERFVRPAGPVQRCTGRHRGPDRTRTGRARPARTGPLQRRDRLAAVPGRGNGEDARRAHPRKTGRAGPDAGGHPAPTKAGSSVPARVRPATLGARATRVRAAQSRCRRGRTAGASLCRTRRWLPERPRSAPALLRTRSALTGQRWSTAFPRRPPRSGRHHRYSRRSPSTARPR